MTPRVIGFLALSLLWSLLLYASASRADAADDHPCHYAVYDAGGTPADAVALCGERHDCTTDQDCMWWCLELGGDPTECADSI